MGKQPSSARIVIGFLALAMVVASCTGGSPTPTASVASAALVTPGPCPAAALDGELVAAADGIALRDPTGTVWRLVLPAGLAIQGAADQAAVVDAAGAVIAKVGDTVSVGGGETNVAGEWNACGGITVVAPA
jgi:hypothetical protein